MPKKTSVKPRKLRGEPQGRLSAQLAQDIGRQILSGIYQPGTLLPNEAEWCQIYGASRTAVREAIKGLNAKGLLASRPKVGSRVEPRERWNMLDRDVLAWTFAVADRKTLLVAIQEVRHVLEPEVAALAARKRLPAQIAELKAALAGMAAAASPAETVEPDVRFHLALLAATNNDLLAPFGTLIASALGNLFDFTSNHSYQPERILRLHRNIYECVAKGQPEAARRAMRALLEDSDAKIALVPEAEQRRRKPAA